MTKDIKALPLNSKKHIALALSTAIVTQTKETTVDIKILTANVFVRSSLFITMLLKALNERCFGNTSGQTYLSVKIHTNNVSIGNIITKAKRYIISFFAKFLLILFCLLSSLFKQYKINNCRKHGNNYKYPVVCHGIRS